MHLEATLTQMREMRLSAMAESLQRRLSNGESHDLSCEDFVAMLIQDEHSSRQTGKLTRLTASALHHDKTARQEPVGHVR
jgi:predicted nucleic acid-binding protein